MDVPEYAVAPKEEEDGFGIEVYKLTTEEDVLTATLVAIFMDYKTAVNFADTWRGKERPVTS